MNISLTPKLEQFIKTKVESGLYKSSSEVVREALRLLEEHHALRDMRFQELKKDIALGIEQADSGETEAFHAQTIKEQGKTRLSEK